MVPFELTADPVAEIMPRARVFNNKAEWLDYKRTRLSGTDFSAIIGEDTYNTPLSIYARMRGLWKPEDISNIDAWLGLRMEGICSEWYEEQTGRTLEDLGEYTLIEHRAIPRFVGTLDRVCKSAEGRKGPGVVELKTSNPGFFYDWVDAPPLKYHFQLLSYLACTEFSWGSLVCLWRGGRHDPILADYIRRRDIEDKLILPVVDKFLTMVDKGIEPPATGLEIDKSVLLGIYGDSVEATKMITLADEYGSDLKLIHNLRANKKALGTALCKVENKVLQAMGDAGAATTRTGWGASANPHKRGNTTVRPLRIRKPKDDYNL